MRDRYLLKKRDLTVKRRSTCKEKKKLIDCCFNDNVEKAILKLADIAFITTKQWRMKIAFLGGSP